MNKVSITKKTLEYLAELSRIELDKKGEDKLLRDLEKILAHFEELKEVDTKDVEPMAGGTFLANIYRQDVDLSGLNAGTRGQQTKRLKEAFSEKEDGYLKIPPVFE